MSLQPPLLLLVLEPAGVHPLGHLCAQDCRCQARVGHLARGDPSERGWITRTHQAGRWIEPDYSSGDDDDDDDDDDAKYRSERKNTWRRDTTANSGPGVARAAEEARKRAAKETRRRPAEEALRRPAEEALRERETHRRAAEEARRERERERRTTRYSATSENRQRRNQALAQALGRPMQEPRRDDDT